MTHLVQHPKGLEARPDRARHHVALVVAVGVSLLVLTTALSTPAHAVSHSAGAGTSHHPHGDQKWDRAQRAQHALTLAKEAFAPATPAAERPDATLALRKLFLLKDALPPADRVEADRLSQRPEKPATIGNDHVLVHYDPAELSPAGYTIDQALATLTYVSDTYAGSGYRRPKSDGTRGGDGRIDIYLDSLEPGLYGYCTSDQEKLDKPGHYDVWAYCVLDNDYAGFPEHTPLQNLQVTAAHEYYHATQYAYDVADDGWFLEATAVTMEDELYPDVNDNLQYLQDSPITRPGKPMDRFGGVFHYGVWNFFRYLVEHFPARTGALPTLLLKSWENADSSKGPRKDRYSVQAVDRALKKVGHTSLAEQFALYSAATRDTHVTFAEGAALNYPSKSLAGQTALPVGKTKKFKTTLDHLTSATYQFVPEPGAAKLRILLRMAPRSTGSRAVVSIYSTTGGLSFKAIKVNARGIAHKKVAVDGTVTAVEITLVNAGTQYRNCYRKQTPFSCSGDPVDDNERARLEVKAS